MNPKTLGVIQLIGAIIAGYLGYAAGDWAALILAILFLITSFHHLSEKRKK